MKFTFKTEKPTGRYKSFESESHYIKLKRKTVGSIDSEDFKIRLSVIKEGLKITDNNPNCDWKWVTLKKENKSLQEAKDFLNTNNILIQQTYNLKLLD